MSSSRSTRKAGSRRIRHRTPAAGKPIGLPGLKGKVAIVTGGAGHIGRAIALQLAGAEVRVAVFDLDLAGAQRVANAAAKLTGSALGLQVDITDHTAVIEAVRQVARQFGRVDILVNNAAKMDAPAIRPEDITLAGWDAAHHVGLRGAFLCVQAVLPFLRRAGRGRVVNISSVVAAAGIRGCVDYVAVKAGLIGLTHGLAREFGPRRITVNAIAPGAVQTPQELRQATPAQVAAIVDKQCLASRVRPVDVANAVLFLASDLASQITGQTLFVDGGWILT